MGDIGSEITDSLQDRFKNFQLKNIPIYLDFKNENSDLSIISKLQYLFSITFK